MIETVAMNVEQYNIPGIVIPQNTSSGTENFEMTKKFKSEKFLFLDKKKQQILLVLNVRKKY